MALVPSPRCARALAASVALVLVPGLATADIPPPPRNEQCSIELMERVGLECLVPIFSAYPELWKERGFEPRCNLYRPYREDTATPPGSVWCRSPLATSSGAAPEPAAPPPAPAAREAPPPAAAARVGASTAALLRLLGPIRRWPDPATPNVGASPLGVWTALATVSAGARGVTATELRRGLQLEGDTAEAVGAARALVEDLRRRGVSFTLSTALLVDAARTPSPEFAAVARAAGVQLQRADFRRYPGDVRRDLDGWIARETGGRSTRLVPPRTLYKSTRLAVASAVGLSARLPEAFAPGAPMPFYMGARLTGQRWKFGFNRSEPVPVASKRVATWRAAGTFAVASLDGLFGFGADDGGVAVDVPLAGGVAMTLVVPHEMTGTAPYVPWVLPKLLERLRPQQVTLTLPAFSLDPPPLSLGDDLVETGPGTPFRDAFDARDGDLSGIAATAAGGERLVLGELFHRVFLDLAAAETATTPARAAPPEPRGRGPAIRLDHPFWVFVRDVESGVVLLVAAINDPAPQQAEAVDTAVLASLGPVARALGDGRVTLGATVVKGGVRREEVREKLEHRLADVTSCFGQQLVLEPALRGTVTMRWKVQPDGRPQDMRGEGPAAGIAGERVRECIQNRSRLWEFRASSPATIEQSWKLQPRSDGARGDDVPAPGRYARRYANQPGERCRPAGIQDGLGVRGDADRPLPRESDLVITGTLEPTRVRTVLEEHAAEVRRVYQQRLAQDRRLQGTVAIEWVVDRDGTVTSPRVDCSATTLDDTFVFEAMKTRIRTWRFPSSRAGNTIVNHRWTFVPLALPGPR